MTILTPSPILAQARHVALHPEEPFTPSVRALAWHILAGARGVHVNLNRLTRLAEAAAGRVPQ